MTSNMKILLPGYYFDIPKGVPVFFLAGPVRGGDDWQWTAAIWLEQWMKKPFIVVIPCRYSFDHPAWSHVPTEARKKRGRQLTWERFWLAKAARAKSKGGILFYLREESEKNPHPGPEPYSMDTRGELGEWRGQLMYRPKLRIFIAARPGYHGLSQVRRNFAQALGVRTFPIAQSIERLVYKATRN